uniref:Polyprenyl synthetase n=1 Tax=Glossina palpalis gambiensis TaxID=67801 RepID=A0A1B0BMH6_9MUSC
MAIDIAFKLCHCISIWAENNSTISSSNNKSNSSNHNNYSKLNVNNKRKCCSSTKTNSRHYSSAHTQQPAGPVREIQIDPYIILDEDLKYVYDDIRERLLVGTTQSELNEIASYYFDGQGKAFRPMVVFLMAKAINYHLNKESSALLRKQRHLALFAEMAHSASLVHDDVIDQSDYRRGKPSVNALWNHKKVTMAGDFILSSASIMIARLRNDEVTILCSKVCKKNY